MKLVENHNQTVFIGKNLAAMIAAHAVTFLVAPFYFTWTAFAFAFGFTLLFAYSMGIFHHMMFTHRSFECKTWIQNLGALFGTLTWRGPFAGPVQYVAGHKIHHQYSDTELDPHTPTKGIYHALIGWFWRVPYGLSKHEIYKGYAPKMLDNPWFVWLDRHVHWTQLGWGVVCFLGGGFLGRGEDSFELTNAFRFLIYGVFVKTVLVVYLTNAVDVINHTVGYRSYETPDQSTNSFIMAFIHLGGAISWHNNHHAHQSYFTVRKKWWELDAHYAFLKFLELFGLAWNIKALDEV
jgi:fatty-acid desaturase